MVANIILPVLAAIAGAGAAQSTFQPARPPAIPLAVRSPYMSTWLNVGSDGGDGGNLAGAWPTFWAGANVGWAGIIRVDGASYTWMGAPMAPDIPPCVNQTSFEYTATRSIFKQQAGPIEITVRFLSPVTPDDFQRASLPFSYMEVEVVSTDGAEHQVQLYTDISAEWISGDRSAIAQWDYGVIPTPGSPKKPASIHDTMTETPSALSAALATETSYTGWRSAVLHTQIPMLYPAQTPLTTEDYSFAATPTAQIEPSGVPNATGGIAYHKVFRATQLAFSEVNQQTEFGSWYYLTNNSAGLTYQQGSGVAVREAFVKNGILADVTDDKYRAINDSFPVFAYSFDLGAVCTVQTRLLGISLNQNDSIQFEGANGIQPIPALWNSYFDNDLDAVSWFYDDYATVSGMCDTLDKKIHDDSVAAAGDNYATITTLSTRQAFGGVALAGTADSPLMFLKEISSDGNVNTVDVIFPMHPILIYTNPTLLKLLLEPLYINQEAGNWPEAFSIHDIGTSYPNATGHNDGKDEMQPLEECGDMIIMSLAYAQRSNDNNWLKSHYKILKQWNEYLVQEALIPANQISTDDFAGALANQTNLAVKGIVGIAAMAEIANRTGNTKDASNYTSIAQDYITKWQGYGINMNAKPPHATLNYGNDSTYGLLYNIFPAKELGLDIIPESVYEMQSVFYPTVFKKYGVPLDTRHNYTKSDWQLFQAAVSSADTRKQFVDAIATWISDTPTNYALTDLYDTQSGNYPTPPTPVFIARPVVGGHFAQLALNSAPS